MNALRPLGVLLVAAVLGGCVYHNVIYNADRLFNRAEADRRAGRDSAAAVGYEDVVRKTSDAYRARPGADWADQALLLLARANLRLGRYAAASAALDELGSRTTDAPLLDEVQVLRAVVDERIGAGDRALASVSVSLSGGLEGNALVEAHLLRGRLLLREGQPDEAAWHLDRAVEAAPEVATETRIERLRWSIHDGDRKRASTAVRELLADPDGDLQSDTVLALVGAGARRWGPAVAAEMLTAVEESSWGGAPRGRAALARAGYLDASGDTAAAAAAARSLARGLGLPAAEARLLLAEWRIRRARDLAEISGLRRLLLPSATDPRVDERLTVVGELESLVGLGLDEPLGLFAAGEIARDRLGAPFVARGLFLAYADQAPRDPWAPKALLAALDSSPDAGDREWIRGRLEAYPDSPYVLAAHGGPAAGFQALEDELNVRLREITRR